MQRKISPVAQKAVDHYLNQAKQLNASCSNPQVVQIREQASQLFAKQGFPTQRDEDWQYTRLTGFVQKHFELKPAQPLTSDDIRPFMPSFAAIVLVFVDGWFNEALSDNLQALPDGVQFELFRDGEELNSNADKLFTNQEKINKEPFGLLNSALLADGFALNVDANTQITMPFYIMNVQTANNNLGNIRNRIEVGENAEVTVVERFVSLLDNVDDSACTNVLTEIFVAKYARVHQVILQDQSEASYYFNNQFIDQQAGSQFNSFFASVGSAISRQQNYLTMNGDHIENNQNSACLATASQTVDSRTNTEHNDTNGISRQLHKYVLSGKATGVFNGMIRVDQKAQKTDGQMDNKNLLLSDSAKMDTKPQLEIYADDVKCSHGSASGQIDENQIFYLQARGIRRQDAINMITHAFLLEPCETIANDAIRFWATECLSKALNSVQQA
ncbi:Fe-S cluster assembly protein SufD [Thiomicrorhabdus sediminis]|uniref:Fe-S cluster assembly protein SufD n=1 Tax=Thiomicrorhabdus sediminis TaxID=2580412 RepID=A0A4P9K6J4_9GAMM|nr:Fe-S cluster assembly protein SufD [Thiomicrorhabdus sediminis]QCU90629.1 Fe-S cluster assembly protein SufD [Thiomicrorhabdus sediminis]